MARRASVWLTFVRGHRHYTKAWLKDAVRYEMVKYHPRTMDHVDRPIVPAKVLMVNRVKPFKGNPYWEKDILHELGFIENRNNPVFVKNTPEMCALLWKVKHLVKIVPVRTPRQLPESIDDTNVYVHESGKVYVNEKLDPARLQATLDARNSIKRMANWTISENLRLRWLKGNLV